MRLSAQLYTVRDQLSKDPKGTLAQLKDCGLEYVEWAGLGDFESAAAAKATLDELGLKSSGAHVGVSQMEDDLAKVIADAKTLGIEFVIVPWIGGDVYSGGWEAVGKRFEVIGRELRAAGLGLAYHNHDFEFKNEGKPGLEVLYDAADPEFLKAELDLAWVSIGGADPAEMIGKLSNRLPLVHLKDYDSAKSPQWQPGGQGVMDWGTILPACDAANVQFGVIELDESAGDPLDAVRESVVFFRSRGLA